MAITVEEKGSVKTDNHSQVSQPRELPPRLLAEPGVPVARERCGSLPLTSTLHQQLKHLPNTLHPLNNLAAIQSSYITDQCCPVNFTPSCRACSGVQEVVETTGFLVKPGMTGGIIQFHVSNSGNRAAYSAYWPIAPQKNLVNGIALITDKSDRLKAVVLTFNRDE